MLFTPLKLRSITLPNRIAMSPMCQYSAVDGVPNSWHLTHLAARAVGGVGTIVAEMTAVSPEGRITPQDTGLWNDTQKEAFRGIVGALHDAGAKAGIQLAHAGRKGSARVPWAGGAPIEGEGSWETLGPSALPFTEGWPAPRAMSVTDIDRTVADFAQAAARAAEAGFDTIMLHAAHGYLLHQFLSPLANVRMDAYGGDIEGRSRFLFRVVEAVRAVWPKERPLWVRLVTTDWHPDGYGEADLLYVAKGLRDRGVDLIDCSSGKIGAGVTPGSGPGYHVPYAQLVRARVGIATSVVGEITDREQAEVILSSGAADVVVIGRALLRDPYLALHWAQDEGKGALSAWPVQYLRGIPEPVAAGRKSLVRPVEVGAPKELYE